MCRSAAMALVLGAMLVSACGGSSAGGQELRPTPQVPVTRLAPTTSTPPTEPTLRSSPAPASTLSTVAATESATVTAPPELSAPVTAAPTTSIPDGRAPPGAFEGSGVWLDVYEWSPSSTDGDPKVTPDQVAAMAEIGMKTLYIQSARTSKEADLSDPDRFGEFVDAAHSHGMKVVSWYLPNHLDELQDLRRVLAPLDAGVDGLGIDLESAKQPDLGLRNQRAIDLVKQATEEAGEVPVGAVTFAPQALDRYEPETWPLFPWQEVADAADVMVPMAYWTIYRDKFPASADPVAYTDETLNLIRERVGPAVPVHSAGGLLNESDTAQVSAAVEAARRHGVIGVSMYSWSGYRPGQMESMRTGG